MEKSKLLIDMVLKHEGGYAFFFLIRRLREKDLPWNCASITSELEGMGNS